MAGSNVKMRAVLLLLLVLVGSVAATEPNIAPGKSLQEKFSQPRNYFDRIKDAFAGFGAGAVCFFMSFLFLFFVEYEACKAYVLMNRAKKACQSEIDPKKVQRKFQNCMVHVSGHMTTATGQQDAEVGFIPSEKCVVLDRKVEVLQWEETSEKSDDKTTYTYAKVWSENDIDSSTFNQQVGHGNPARKYPFQSTKIMNERVNLEAFELKPNVLSKLDNFKDADLSACSNKHRDFRVGSTHLMSGDGENVGDMRISYRVHLEGPVSICAVQTENTFRRFLMDRDGAVGGHDKSHFYESVADEEPAPQESCCVCATFVLNLVGTVFPHTVLLVESGSVGKEEMFKNATSDLSTKQTIMRLVGFVLMLVGMYLMLKPIAELLSFIPFLGAILKSLFFVAALLVSAVLTFITIALSWVWFHPEMLAGILGVVGGLFWLNGANQIPGHPCGDPDDCTTALTTGQVVVGLACVPFLYLIYLQVQEFRYAQAIKAEMEAREQDPQV